MDTQSGTRLCSSLHIHHLTSAFYCRLDADFDYPGEAHTGWEFVYVEQGSIRVRANDAAYILKSGEMVCHQPMEFHHTDWVDGKERSGDDPAAVYPTRLYF